VRARSGAVTADAAGDLARGDVTVASLMQMSDEGQQGPRDSKGFRKGASGGDLGRDLRRGRQSSP